MTTQISNLPTPSPADWCLTEDEFRPGLLPHYESIFALANGYMGVRASLDTNPMLGDPGFYIAGVFDNVHGHVHEIVNLPTWLGIAMNVDGFPVDLRKGTLLEYKRTLDMKQGILFTHIVWRDAANHTTRFELGMLVHQAEKHLALQWGTITPLDYSANVGFESMIDAWAVKYASPSREVRLRNHETAKLDSEGIVLGVSTKKTDLRIGLASRIEADGAENRCVSRSDDRISESLTVPVRKGESIFLHKKILAFTSRDGGNPQALAEANLERLAAVDVEELVLRHTKAWADAWERTDIRIDGDERAQKAVRFNSFHLASLANPDDTRISLGAKGLHGNGYAGVYFWDTEIFMLPFYTHTNPTAAKALLEYRYHMLEDAHLNAKDLNRRGAFYPWNSSINGRGHHWLHWQEHVGSDIAYGIDWYCRATGDTEFLHGQGAEIIFETARYWQSRVEPHPERGYELTGLMGPDEIHGNIANNAYTNFLVKWHLDLAAKLADELKVDDAWKAMAARLGLTEADLAAWVDIAEKLYFPFDEERNIHEQFEGYFQLPDKEIDRSLSRMQYTGPVQGSFRPTKVAQQADTVLMYWMFPEAFPDDVRKAGYNYYDPRCSHTSSLSRCIFAAVAAQTGMVEEAYRQFMLSAEADIAPGLEMESESGIHAACMGGTYLATLTGFGGAWPRGDILTLNPRLPAHWTGMAFPLAWHGHVLEVEIKPDACRLRTRGGTVQVQVGTNMETIKTEWSHWLPLEVQA